MTDLTTEDLQALVGSPLSSPMQDALAREVIALRERVKVLELEVAFCREYHALKGEQP